MKKKCTFRLCGYIGLFERSTDVCGATLHWNSSQGVCHLQIGKDIPESRVTAMLLHELFEGCADMLGYRFTATSANNYDDFFQFNHSDLTNIMEEVSATYNEIITKLNSKKRGIE